MAWSSPERTADTSMASVETTLGAAANKQVISSFPSTLESNVWIGSDVWYRDNMVPEDKSPPDYRTKPFHYRYKAICCGLPLKQYFQLRLRLGGPDIYGQRLTLDSSVTKKVLV